MNTHLNKYQKFFIIYYFILLVYWVILMFSGLKDDFWNFFFSFSFSLVPLVAGLIGCLLAKYWGWIKSAIGRGIFFVSLGSFLWGAGSMIWSYYNFFADVAAPYPSLADVGFVLSLPCWIYGVINISKATGAKVGLKQKAGKIFAILIPIAVVIASYYFLVIVARGGVIVSGTEDILKLLLDLAYPVGDIVILTLALLIFGLSLNYLGGKYRATVLIMLFGFGMMYLADFTFSYTTTLGTFFNGNFGDLLFATALALISIGSLGFAPDQINS